MRPFHGVKNQTSGSGRLSIRSAPGAARSAPTPEVCPPPGVQPSAWAQDALGFQPGPQQAEVLDADSRFLVLCCHRQWGKTTTIAIKALHAALSQPEQTIVIVSRTKLQAGILIDRATSFIARLRIPPRRVLGHQFSLRLPNGSRIFAVAHSQETAVGNTANVLIVDEAALVQDHVYFAVAPFIARTAGALWLLSTPRRQAGFFYNIWHDEDPRWLRIFSSIQANPGAIDQAFLDLQRAADPIRFRQDFLCEFVQPADRLIDMDTLKRMLRTDIDQYQLEY
jgi:hypothetical protein